MLDINKRIEDLIYIKESIERLDDLSEENFVNVDNHAEDLVEDLEKLIKNMYEDIKKTNKFINELKSIYVINS